MRIVFLGSGAFGLPTLQHLAAHHQVELVVTQPDRPSGRGRTLTPTPIGAWADEAGLPCLRVEDVNAPDAREHIRSLNPDAMVIIAFGQKLGGPLIADVFAMNLHASLLPRHRGAAPIHHAILAGDSRTGLSVITIADRIDAGDVLAQCETDIRPDETTGTLHDRLASMGPELIELVLQSHADGSLVSVPQAADEVTVAPKLSKDRATVHFDQDACSVRNGVHGLVPWPGCTVCIGPNRLRLLKLEVLDRDETSSPPGSISPDGIVSCNPGHVRLLEVQSPGRRPMPFAEWLHGHPIDDTSKCSPMDASS